MLTLDEQASGPHLHLSPTFSPLSTFQRTKFIPDSLLLLSLSLSLTETTNMKSIDKKLTLFQHRMWFYVHFSDYQSVWFIWCGFHLRSLSLHFLHQLRSLSSPPVIDTFSLDIPTRHCQKEFLPVDSRFDHVNDREDEKFCNFRSGRTRRLLQSELRSWVREQRTKEGILPPKVWVRKRAKTQPLQTRLSSSLRELLSHHSLDNVSSVLSQLSSSLLQDMGRFSISSPSSPSRFPSYAINWRIILIAISFCALNVNYISCDHPAYLNEGNKIIWMLKVSIFIITRVIYEELLSRDSTPLFTEVFTLLWFRCLEQSFTFIHSLLFMTFAPHYFA